MSSGSDDKVDGKKALNRTGQVFSDKFKGALTATKNYSIILKDRTTAVNIFDNASKNWLVRFDTPHGGANFNHININPKVVTGLAKDPHIPISPGVIQGVENTARFLKAANKVLLPLAIAIDATRVGWSAYEDITEKTCRNSVTTLSSIVGGWSGGFGGAAGGAAIGSLIFPGIGTLAGAIIGGISGGIGCAIGAEKAADAIAEATDLDIEWFECQLCGEKYKCRKYKGQSREFCPECCKKREEKEAKKED